MEEEHIVGKPKILPLPRIMWEDTVRRALAEDLGRGGDLTTDAVVPPDLPAMAVVLARRPGALAGVEIAAATFQLLDPDVHVEILIPGGEVVAGGGELMRIRGAARSIVTAERTALNILGRLSGTATLTRAFVDAVSDTDARVVCTRKTTPGLRALEKYAVRCGGGWNHRFGLDDAVLIKDNHVAAAGGIGRALARARSMAGHTVKIEVEVDTLDQLREALAEGVEAVLLDNMAVDMLREAVALVDGRVITEASGNITLDNVAQVAAAGVDLISVGAITHSAPALDVSLELVV